MLFYSEIMDIRRHADTIDRVMGPLERIQWDRADLRRFNLRQSAKELRAAADRCDAVADRFDDTSRIAIELLEAAE